ncbi:hypothetical protein NC652_014300 [Populus alba x Populus x berolinensis]|nr:hypothetical protein NC652_014300 [Populus alba x Populus x berolinensis]
MESPLSPSHVVIAYDATKDRGVHELKLTIDEVRMRGDILRGGDTLLFLEFFIECFIHWVINSKYVLILLLEQANGT